MDGRLDSPGSRLLWKWRLHATIATAPKHSLDGEVLSGPQSRGLAGRVRYLTIHFNHQFATVEAEDHVCRAWTLIEIRDATIWTSLFGVRQLDKRHHSPIARFRHALPE